MTQFPHGDTSDGFPLIAFEAKCRFCGATFTDKCKRINHVDRTDHHNWVIFTESVRNRTNKFR